MRDIFGLYGGSNILEVTTGQGNYVVNGDFEQDLTGWELYTPDPCVTIADDLSSPAGSKVLKAEMASLQMVNISAELLQTISQEKLIAGKTYTLSFSAKTETITGNGIMYVFLVKSNDWTHRWVQIKLNHNASPDWTQYTADFVAPTSDSPYSLVVYAGPDIPWSEADDRFKVLLDGFSLHKKR